MINLSRHLRGLLIATVALSMSAGLAAAARPTSDRSANGAAHANVSGTSEPDESEAPEASESPDQSESPDASAGTDGAGDNCATDPTGLTPEQLATMTHGSIVCWAAQQDTPEGWDNHGAWVRHWAQMNHGADASATGKTHGAAGKSHGHASQP